MQGLCNIKLLVSQTGRNIHFKGKLHISTGVKIGIKQLLDSHTLMEFKKYSYHLIIKLQFLSSQVLIKGLNSDYCHPKQDRSNVNHTLQVLS